MRAMENKNYEVSDDDDDDDDDDGEEEDDRIAAPFRYLLTTSLTHSVIQSLTQPLITLPLYHS